LQLFYICSDYLPMERPMATEAQVAANRANAQKSTGPRTDEGKAVSAMNALRHGLCAERFLIAEEEREDWEALRADWRDRLRPEGIVEERLCERIAQVSWRRDRGPAAEAAAWRERSQNVAIVSEGKWGDEPVWRADGERMMRRMGAAVQNGVLADLSRLTLYEGRLSRELQKLRAELAALQDERRRRAAAEPRRPDPEAPAEPLAPARPAAAPAPVSAPEPAPEPRKSADIGFVPAPSEPPAAGAPLAEWEAWHSRESARIEAEAKAVAARRDAA